LRHTQIKQNNRPISKFVVTSASSICFAMSTDSGKRNAVFWCVWGLYSACLNP
jgi:hypothetical protein